MKATNFLEELGDTVINEILTCSEESKLNKDYYDLVASEKAINMITKISCNPFTILQAKQVIKSLGIISVGQLINEYKFPRTDRFGQHIRNIIKECRLFDILAKRKCLSYGINYRQKFFLVTNNPINEFQFTTKLIRQCLFKSQIISSNGLSKTFSGCVKITHP
jgi:hypothetical protein